MVHHPGFGRPFRDLDTGLYASAHWIWDRRGVAKRLAFPFSEETVTETVLLDLAAELPGAIHIVPFTKPEEGKTGADWEWCLHDAATGRYLRFLVQAKVLDDRDRVYAHIDRYVGNTGVRQIDRLWATSVRRRVPALYAFYNHLDDPSRLPLHHCACHQCVGCWGASVAPLGAVYPRVMGSPPDKTFDTLAQVSVAWRCLLCAGAGGGPERDPIDGAIAGLNRLAALARERSPDTPVGDLPSMPEAPEREPPDYLRPLLGLAEDMGAAPPDDAVRCKLAGDNPGVDGVVLVDATRARRRGRPDD